MTNKLIILEIHGSKNSRIKCQIFAPISGNKMAIGTAAHTIPNLNILLQVN